MTCADPDNSWVPVWPAEDNDLGVGFFVEKPFGGLKGLVVDLLLLDLSDMV